MWAYHRCGETKDGPERFELALGPRVLQMLLLPQISDWRSTSSAPGTALLLKRLCYAGKRIHALNFMTGSTEKCVNYSTTLISSRSSYFHKDYL